MKSSKLVFGSLSTALFLAIYSLNASAQSSNGWVEQALGSYQSQVWSGGSLVSGTTEFEEANDGSLEGSYTMDEAGKIVPGTLSQCQSVQVRIMRCVWNDEYGTGNLEVAFSEDFSSFYGYWGVEGSELAFRWNGSR